MNITSWQILRTFSKFIKFIFRQSFRNWTSVKFRKKLIILSVCHKWYFQCCLWVRVIFISILIKRNWVKVFACRELEKISEYWTQTNMNQYNSNRNIHIRYLYERMNHDIVTLLQNFYFLFIKIHFYFWHISIKIPHGISFM